MENIQETEQSKDVAALLFGLQQVNQTIGELLDEIALDWEKGSESWRMDGWLVQERLRFLLLRQLQGRMNL